MRLICQEPVTLFSFPQITEAVTTFPPQKIPFFAFMLAFVHCSQITYIPSL